MRNAWHPMPQTVRMIMRSPTAADLDLWTARILADPAVVRDVPSRIIERRARAERMLASFSACWARRGDGTCVLSTKAGGPLPCSQMQTFAATRVSFR